VSQGTLALANSGSIDSSSTITVSAGAVLDLSALPTPILTLTSGRSLKGSGAIIGNVTMATGSTLAVGGPGTNTIGTLTVTNNLVLQGGSTNLMEISKVSGTTNDQVVATNVTYGGTLTVSGVGGAYVPGDIFKLFAATTYVASSFSTINLPVGVTWDTSQLGVDGTIRVVSVTRPQIGAITPGGGGSFQLSFSGPAGNNYRVWANTNLISANWTLITNGLFGASGTATVLDTTATNYPARFYRVSVP
jgi:fibronectin-binding autotransporter adhesin